MPRNIRKQGASPDPHPNGKDELPHRVAARLEGVVKNTGIKKVKKEGKRRK